MGISYPSEQPDEHEVEVSVLGGGSGLGESIVIHYGEGRWIIVDSLTEPKSKVPMPLAYLHRLGVDSAQVKAVVATHWHDDHIRGLHDLLAHTKEAKFVCSGAIEGSQFFTLVSLDPYISDKNRSGLSEFRRILSVRKNAPITRAVADRLLLQDQLPDGKQVCLWALSPSDETLSAHDREVGKLIKLATQQKQIPQHVSNHVSVVLLLEIGKTRIILGSDLEVTSHPRTGWTAVLACESFPTDNSVSFFKVAHHGSENGHYSPFWEKALSQPDPALALTPYNRGRKPLPSSPDIARMLFHSQEAYITSSPNSVIRNKAAKRSDPRLNRAIADSGINIRERRSNYGQLRFRKPLRGEEQVSDAPTHGWEVALFGAARSLNKLGNQQE